MFYLFDDCILTVVSRQQMTYRNVCVTFQDTSTPTSSPPHCKAEWNQAMNTPGSPQSPCTPRVAVWGKSSPTTTWSIQIALPPVLPLSLRAVVLSRGHAPSLPWDPPNGDTTSGAPAKEAAGRVAARGWAQPTAALPRGSPEDVMCA